MTFVVNEGESIKGFTKGATISLISRLNSNLTILFSSTSTLTFNISPTSLYSIFSDAKPFAETVVPFFIGS